MQHIISYGHSCKQSHLMQLIAYRGPSSVKNVRTLLTMQMCSEEFCMLLRDVWEEPNVLHCALKVTKCT